MYNLVGMLQNKFPDYKLSIDFNKKNLISQMNFINLQN